MPRRWYPALTRALQLLRVLLQELLLHLVVCRWLSTKHRSRRRSLRLLELNSARPSHWKSCLRDLGGALLNLCLLLLLLLCLVLCGKKCDKLLLLCWCQVCCCSRLLACSEELSELLLREELLLLECKLCKACSRCTCRSRRRGDRSGGSALAGDGRGRLVVVLGQSGLAEERLCHLCVYATGC